MARKNRVLVNFSTPFPNVTTGISVYAFRTLQALLERDRFDYTLMTNWDPQALPPKIRNLEVPVIQIKLAKSDKLSYLQSIYHVRRVARELRSDIVFTPQPYGPPVGGRARIMVVHDLYRHALGHHFRIDRRLTWKAIFRIAVRCSTAIVCVSTATQQEFTRYYRTYAHKSVVIHEASPIDREDKLGARKEQTEPPYGLVVANATSNKNFECIFMALELLRRERLKPEICWVGRDETGAISKLRSMYPGLDNFVAVGSIDDVELRARYQHAQFYLNASLAEGFCLPILEAQTFGVPVVCSDISVLREVAGTGALFFDPSSPESLAKTIREIVTDADVRGRLQREGERNVALFSWDKAASELEALFVRTISRSG